MMARERAGLGCLVLGVVGAASLTARAQEPPSSPSTDSPRPAFRPSAAEPEAEMPVHHGFFLRLQSGVGFTMLRGSGGYVGVTTISGAGELFGVAIGGEVVRNVAVFGTLFTSTASNPDFATGGVDAGRNGGSAALRGFAGGIVYYFEPLNLSGALATVSMLVQNLGITIDQSNYGFGIEGIVGKEWWLSRHWGLGAAAELLGTTGMTDKYDSNLDWSALAVNLLVSATYF
jgi:hypothetical protein